MFTCDPNRPKRNNRLNYQPFQFSDRLLQGIYYQREMSGEANKDEEKGTSPTGVPSAGDLSKFVPLEGSNDKEPENNTTEKKGRSSTESAAMQGQYQHYQVGLGQPHFLYPQQQQTQSSAPSSPSEGVEFDAQAAVFMQQQGTSSGNPFHQMPTGIPNLPLTAQTQSAPPSTQGGMGVLASTAFSNFNPHMEGGGNETGATTATAPYVPSGSPVQSAYTSQGTGMYAPYGDGESPHWPDSNMQQGQHLYQPHHIVQQQQMAVPHYLPTHGPNGYGNRGSPPFVDEMSPAPTPGNMENQESFSSYTQNQGSMPGSNLAAASTAAPLWGYHHPQMPQMEYPSHLQAMSAMPKASPPHQHHYYLPGPPIQTTDSNKGPDGANLFIFHIPNNFTNVDMYNLFCRYGRLVSVRIMVEKDTGRSRGFGFVSYDNPESAAIAIKELNGMVVANKRLKVQHKQIRATDHANDLGNQNAPGSNQPDPNMNPTVPASNFDLNSARFESAKVASNAPLWHGYETAASTSKPFPEEAMAKISKELETSTESPNSSSPKKSTEQKKPKEDNSRSQDPKFPQQQLNSSRNSNRKGLISDNSGLNHMGTLRNALPDTTS